MGFFAVEFNNGVPERNDDVSPALVLKQEIPTRVKGAHPPFFMPELFGYEYQANGDCIVVPYDVNASSTDLASIPVWLGWLAAKTGRNLPAALLHDVLIVKDQSQVNHWVGRTGEAFQQAPAPYPRGDADSMFRDAMGDVGVDRLRRWIMWAGVSIGTFWTDLPDGWRRIQALIRGVVLGLLALFVGLYLLPNMVVDLRDTDWWFGWQMPGMGDRPWLQETGSAIVIIFVFSLVATLLFAVGTRRAAYWRVGAMFVITLFLLGWLIVFSYAQDKLFKARLLFPRRSAVVTSPSSQTTQTGATAAFEAKVELKKGHTIKWVEETADGEVTELEGLGSELQIEATPARDGAKYRVQIYEDDKLIDESFAAQLTLQSDDSRLPRPQL